MVDFVYFWRRSEMLEVVELEQVDQIFLFELGEHV